MPDKRYDEYLGATEDVKKVMKAVTGLKIKEHFGEEMRIEFEEATKKILEITGCAVITGMTMACLYGKDGGNYFSIFKEEFKGYTVELMPHMDAYLIRRELTDARAEQE